MSALRVLTVLGLLGAPYRLAASDWISAIDGALVQRTGSWSEASYRRASTKHLVTQADGAALEFGFHGPGLMLTMDAHGLPFAHLGTENLGVLEVSIDGGPPVFIHPQREDRDVVLARGLQDRTHSVRVVHRATRAGAGVRIAGFRVLRGREGELSLLVHGDASRFLTDARAVLSIEGKTIASRFIRNWMNGLCRIGGIPAGRGYELEVRASGWEPVRLRGIEVAAGKETALAPLYLRRTRESTAGRVEFPRMGAPSVLRAGESFPSRVAVRGASIQAVVLERHARPARISRVAVFTEDKNREYDGFAEGTVKTPADVPPGLYDLVYKLDLNGRRTDQVAPRSVHVVSEFPRNPVFVTFGHMDTFGQEPAEYLERLAELSNLIGPDMVLVSNEVNAAYVSGALSRLDVPHFVTFGNHEVSGHEEWYGNAVTMTDFGPDLAILNLSHAWHGDLSHAYALLESRERTACRIINAFEHDAPVEDMLDRYRIPFLHEAHGPNPKVTQIGRTPTQRAGKMNSESFRVVRFQGCRAVSFTYAGDKEAPIPLPRHEPVPMRLTFSPANDGTHRSPTALVVNKWQQSFAGARITFVLPRGEYGINRGRIESAIISDDARFTVLTVRVDVPAASTVAVTASPQ